jgi:hypothetical protein
MRSLAFAWILVMAGTGCNNYGLLDKFESPGSANSISHFIFVSSYKTHGMMTQLTNGNCSGGGMQQADCACRDMAKSAGLPNSDGYLAWLSQTGTPNLSAVCRVQGIESSTCVVNGNVPWYNRKGELVASSLGELTNPNGIKAAIRYTEHAVETIETEVYTGTSSAGHAAPNHCTQWTVNTSIQADVGNPHTNSSQWTDKQLPTMCSNQRPIYCLRRL